MEGDLKITFIQKSLAEYNRRVINAIRIAAQRAKVGVTGEAVNSLAYQAFQTSTGGYSNLSFREYLRFVDMGVGSGHPLGGLKGVTKTLQASKLKGIALLKDNTRKPKKIYSKIAYGNLTWLQNELLYGYTQETIDSLKKEMQ